MIIKAATNILKAIKHDLIKSIILNCLIEYIKDTDILGKYAKDSIIRVNVLRCQYIGVNHANIMIDKTGRRVLSIY